MKIVGTAENGRFICTLSSDEIANVAGFRYDSQMNPRPAAGQEIKVSELWQALLASRERKEELTKLADQLRAAGKRVDSINEALAAPIIEVKVAK